VVARGLHRVRILAVDWGGPHLRAAVDVLPNPVTPPRPHLVELLSRHLEAHGGRVGAQATAELIDPSGIGPARAVWLAGAIVQASPDRRQQLLETGDPDLAEALLDDEL
jgi:hypothetical protein